MDRATWVEISRAALRANHDNVAKHAGVPVCAVVKANAYGHGIVECARIFASAGAVMLGVTRIDEARAIREGGVESPILIMMPVHDPQEAHALRCTITVGSLEDVARVPAGARVHLKVDTGMGRLGVSPGDAVEVAAAIARTATLDGVYTHFASLAHAKAQLDRFNAVLAALRHRGIEVTSHAANSGATLAVAGGQQVESGSGWVLDADRGLIVTNAHVINAGSSFQVGTASGLQPARVVAAAPCEDLAVLRVRRRAGLRRLALGSQSSLKLGETVIALGYPGNASTDVSLTSTKGVVSVPSSQYVEPALDVPRYPDVVQTDTAINPGSSGGPLIDLTGRLVGVNSAGRTRSPDGKIIQGQSYAIGVDRVKRILPRLAAGRSIGWVGAGFRYSSSAGFARGDRAVGIGVGAAVPDTAAAGTPLGTPGTKILAVGDRAVGNSLAGWCDAVEGIASGQRATLRYVPPHGGRARSMRIRFE